MSTSVLTRMQQRATAKLIPMEAMVVVTERCHLRCQQCYLVENPRPEMSTQEIYDIFDQLVAAGTFFAVITGGEPLLRPDIYDIIRYATEKGVLTTIFTTATSCNPTRVEKLCEAGLTRASISVYSADPTFHDEVTQIPGSLEKTIEGARNLSAAGIHVQLKFLQMTTNVGQLEGVRALADELQAEFSIDFGINVCHDGRRDPLQLQAKEELLFQLQLKLADEDPDGLGKVVPKPGRAGQHMCSAGRTRVVVGTNGEVYSCLRLTKPIGDIKRAPLKEIWQDKPVTDFRKLKKFSDPICRVCPDQAFCDFCPGQSLLNAGNATSPNATTCMKARVKRRVYEAQQKGLVSALRQPLAEATTATSTATGCQQCSSDIQHKLDALLQQPSLFSNETHGPTETTSEGKATPTSTV